MRQPTHRQVTITANGTETVYESKPTHKLTIKGYCKYCYTTHRDWWQMSKADYSADVVLCGKCEYTSLKENV